MAPPKRQTANERAKTIGELGIIMAILCPFLNPASLNLLSQSNARLLSRFHDHHSPRHQMQLFSFDSDQYSTNLSSSLLVVFFMDMLATPFIKKLTIYYTFIALIVPA
jgi:hypothetical protein